MESQGELWVDAFSSNTVRFEVFNRDDFTCQYCGRSPEKDKGVILELDHITPKSEGGKDDVHNLRTSCRECNQGKSNIPLKFKRLSLEEQLEKEKAKEDKVLQLEQLRQRRKRRENAFIDSLRSTWENYYIGIHGKSDKFSDQFEDTGPRTWLQLDIDPEEIRKLMNRAISEMKKKGNDEDRAIHYWMKSVWNIHKARVKAAREEEAE